MRTHAHTPKSGPFHGKYWRTNFCQIVTCPPKIQTLRLISRPAEDIIHSWNVGIMLANRAIITTFMYFRFFMRYNFYVTVGLPAVS